MAKVTLIIAVLAVVITVCPGCGGGGGSASIPTSATIRQIASGNQVVYNVSGTASSGAQSGPVTGTTTMTAYADTITPIVGNRAFRLVTELDLTYNGTHYPVNGTSYIEQDASGTIYDTGSEGERLASATAAPVMYASPIATGQTHSFTSTYSDLVVEQNDYVVLGKEAAAGYESYKVHSTWSSGSTTGSGDDWLVPDLGMPVRMTVTTMDSGIVFSLTATMVSKNF